jgi:hypothetical protein
VDEPEVAHPRASKAPWTSFDDALDVPDAKSSRSTSATAKPWRAASSATPAPMIPPPTTSRSKPSDRSRSRLVARGSSTTRG